MNAYFILPLGRRGRACAPSALRNWVARLFNVDIRKAKAHVYRLQMRIAKAARQKRYNKVSALQWLLSHSFYAKILGVHRVMSNKGHKTAGVDGVLWKSDEDKANAVLNLKRRGYQSEPLRRILIPKSNGKKRPLGIPTLHDRAMQALYHLGLDPVAEVWADDNSYGFRQKRSCQDALQKAFTVLARKKVSPHWILDADIKGCFDHINHDWMLENIPMDRQMLATWLKCGYIDHSVFHRTNEGTPQGGIISATLCNMALDGLEQHVHQAVPRKGCRVNFIRYADDFIITAINKEWLTETILPVVKAFLTPRGLTLSEEKTHITTIHQGFDFLGCTLRKYSNTLLITPKRSKVYAFARQIRELIRKGVALPTRDLLGQLNRKLRGWFHYYRAVVSKRAFAYIDLVVYKALWQWMHRRHPKQGKYWLHRRYFRSQRTPSNTYRQIFYGQYSKVDGTRQQITLFKLSDLSIRRHVKIRSQATPYDPTYRDYFRKRWYQQGFKRETDKERLAKYHLVF
jgi:RNA-directed DNA polymerase